MGDFYSYREGKRASSIDNKLAAHPVAYFCMEFCLPENLPIYAGGLGVLAGDYVMEAEQQNFPMIGIGLFYPEKCFVGKDGGYCVPNNPIELGLHPVSDKLGQRIFFEVPVGNHNLKLQAWLYQKGTVPVYLLDGNLPENSEEDRGAMSLLYTASPEGRLTQEIALGIGGIRLIEILGLAPSVYHMNEGHSAFLAFELANNLMKAENIEFKKAFEKAKTKIAFTNHTLVVGGHDVFSNKLVEKLFQKFCKDSGIKWEEMKAQGNDTHNKSVFSATFLALNSAARINAVSALHGVEANKLWPEYSTLSVTNGINIRRWDRVRAKKLGEAHRNNKRELLKIIKDKSGAKWKESDLIVSWARRVVSYKRPIAIFEDLPRLKKMLNNRKNPLRLLFSGAPHYHDSEGLYLLNYIRQLSQKELRGKLVFLEKYNAELSSSMISGSDIWLNTPIVGLEACGTSGMKAALNGVIPCSTDDGWVPEVELNEIGYKLDDKFITLSLLDTLNDRIIPEYYQQQKVPNTELEWNKKMRLSRQEILQRFGSDRMLSDYIEKIYKPILSES